MCTGWFSFLSNISKLRLIITIQHYNFTCYLYEHETWFVTLKHDHRLMIFENRAQKILFVSKREEVTED
jgi:hypothetical protein